MEPSITTKSGIIYCRVSSKDQVDGTSLDSQERICGEYAQKLGIHILQIFIEKGESAKTTDRTQFTKAISLCSKKKPQVDYFIVYKLDRFARNQDDHAIVRQMLKKYGTEIKSATEPIGDTPVGRAMEGMISVFAEFDNNVRRERCMCGMRERIKQGVWCWATPFGFKRLTQGSNIVPDPEITPYIRLAFEEYAKGIHTFESLANLLGEQGLKTRNGCKPFKQFVERMLKNPIYCGIIEMWGERCKGDFEPIISEALFAQCQDSYRHIPALSLPRLQAHPLFPLRKLVICTECEKPFTGSFSRGKMGNKYPYYHHHRQDCPKATCHPKKTLEDKFIAYLEEITPKPKFEKIFKQTAIEFWKNETQNYTEKRKIAQREIGKLEYEKQRIFEFHRTGTYTDEEFTIQKRILNAQIEQKQNLLQKSSIPLIDMEKALETCFKYARITSQIWVDADYGEKIEFQKLVFPSGKVEYNGEKFETPKLSFSYGKNQRDDDGNIGSPESGGNTGFETPNLSFIYALNKLFDGRKSQVVDLPRRILNSYGLDWLKKWVQFDELYKKQSMF